MNSNHQIKRNITLYIVGVYLLATVGGAITATVNEAGGLIFAISPLLMTTLLRFFGGDGWKDAGLSLKLKESWQWYLFSLFAYPITIAVVIGVGALLGMITVNVDLNTLLPTLIMGIGIQLAPRLILATFEEWGWRGYLEPRLMALGVPDLRRHFFVGVIWAIWHFPLIFSTKYTDLPYPIFLPLFGLGVTITAIVYGQMRKASETVWTSVLMHGVGNTVLWAIIQADVLTINQKILVNPAPEGILMILCWSALAWWLLSRPGQEHSNQTLGV